MVSTEISQIHQTPVPERQTHPPADLAQEALEASPSMIVSFSPDGNLLLTNQNFRNLFGLDPQLVSQTNLFDSCEANGLQYLTEKIQHDLTFLSPDNPQVQAEYIFPLQRGEYLNIITGWTHTGIFSSDGQLLRVVSQGDDVTEKKHLEKKLEAAAMHDPLTGVYSLAYYNEERSRLIHSRHPVGSVMIDVDGMKFANDQSEDGHSEGDKLLIEVAKIAKSVFRQGDCICRDQGDEFRILLSDPNLSEETLMEKEDRLHELAAQANANKPAGQRWDVSFSVGWTICPTVSYYDHEAGNIVTKQDITTGERISDKKMYLQKEDHHRIKAKERQEKRRLTVHQHYQGHYLKRRQR